MFNSGMIAQYNSIFETEFFFNHAYDSGILVFVYVVLVVVSNDELPSFSNITRTDVDRRLDAIHD